MSTLIDTSIQQLFFYYSGFVEAKIMKPFLFVCFLFCFSSPKVRYGDSEMFSKVTTVTQLGWHIMFSKDGCNIISHSKHCSVM